MTLTAEQVQQYEARAAAGEEPVLPWGTYYQTDFQKVTNKAFVVSIGGPFYACLEFDWSVCPGDVSEGAAHLAADDALAAFAAPLREREVPGPWWAFEGHDGTWYVAGICPPMTNLVPLSMCTECHDAAEARAIANVRNLFHARRQAKEASRVD